MILLGLNGLLVLAFVLFRAPMRDDGWAFLDRERESEMTVVADGIAIVLARRPIGGWESFSVRWFLLLNLPAFFASAVTFQLLQSVAIGSSRLNSDLATIVFIVIAVAQWLGVSALVSLRRTS